MTFPRSPEEVEGALDAAEAIMAESGLPYGMVMEKGTVCDEDLDQEPVSPRPEGTYQDSAGETPEVSRIETLEQLLEIIPDEAAVIATTGKSGRELFTLADRPQHLYQVGSMGCASGMGLGVALNSERPVVVLDGDGAALMKMGAFATIGAYAPKNLIHIVLDNGVHDSTGGQATVSSSVDFAKVATACRYATGSRCDSLNGFSEAFRSALSADGPHMIQMRIEPGSMDNLGRPTVGPADVAIRFKEFVTGNGKA